MNLNQSEYLLTLLLCFAFPFIFSILHRKFIAKYHLQILQPSIFIAAIPFILFDIIAVERGYWKFNAKFITGIHIVNLPIEEYLFFLLIPQSALLIWIALKRYSSNHSVWDDIIQHFKKNN